ncbi:ABC transporter substrate-binding protein [Bradyrhizobium jicamae]|uniref:ABC transporter substrate-binding protein n=1 Tax=Bradyrhizobium jicamae TaxID=280332 RepID=UPI001BAAD745|nr:ABC transporter substrate-binding protein [Bradyrhizobium jicamae]MBR0939030.1 ABC transporter substrate-binding protein [Bradyrhizobium jicamae]
MVDRKRRGLLFALAYAPATARAEQPRRIAWLGPGSAEKQGHYVTSFKDGMRENNLFEGRDYILDVQYAEGHYDRFPAMVQAALGRDPAVIIVVTVASVRAAQLATRGVPIVFISTNDPVGSGLVASLARPGGNTTGISNQGESKYVDLLRDALPQARRVAVLMNPSNPSNPRLFQQLRETAQTLGITANAFEVLAPEQLDAAFKSIASFRPDALLMISDAVLFETHERIAAFALEERVPTIAPSPEQAEAGMLFGYGTSRPEMYRHAGTYVKKILAGAKPADLPIEQPTRFELVVNLKIAKALGLTIPETLLAIADKVIE